MIIDHRIKFLHIPHTGGRFLSYNFDKNFICTHANFQHRFKNCEVPHLNAFESDCFFPSSRIFKTFTVVRNPLDKFISCLKDFSKVNQNLIKYMFENKTNFFNILNHLREDKTNNNWFEPQINFIEHDTKIWKFEDGFDKKFNKWMLNNLNIKMEELQDDELKNAKFPGYPSRKINLNNREKQYIKNYYFLDYKILKY